MYILERWNGTTWYESMLSPFADLQSVEDYLAKYSGWHYNEKTPYRLHTINQSASDRTVSLD